MIEDEQFQELYKKTHNNYMPSEQITRGYTCPYEKTNANGISTPHDPSGIWVPKALRWCQMEDNNIVGKRQAEFKDGNKTKLPNLHDR
uniref:(California timema) hypothetical protein n=1 Tax=Timema californicum TaxID=61474 RepID=A0A7R9JJD1_TIMCA|nr:unnamed protein product [Timema californicum]